MTEELGETGLDWIKGPVAVACPQRLPSWRVISRLRRSSRVQFAGRWLHSFVLLELDILAWVAVYVVFSHLFSTSVYGMIELFAPAVILLLSLSLIGGYKPRENMASLRYAAEHLIACICGFILAALAVYLIGSYSAPVNSSRGVFLSAAAGFCVLSLFYRRMAWFRFNKASARKKLLVVGDQEMGAYFCRALQKHGFAQKVEYVAASEFLVGCEVAGPGSQVFESGVGDLPATLYGHPENEYEAIVVAAAGDNLQPDTLSFLATVHFQELPVYSMRAFYEAYWEKMPAELLSPVWPLQAGFHLVKHSAFAAAKRLFDLVAALIAVVLLSPVLAAIALAIRLDSKGPVIFRQTRVGQHRRPFTLLKFRTMKIGSERKGIYTETNDPRITRTGRLLRATRLDELPQLFNVLSGDMSIIGPRAEWIKCVGKYEKVIPHYHFRHLVRPGITGWAQVNYPYGASIEDAVEKLMYDLYYIRNFSLILDASVILKTIHVMLFGKGR